jgi:hypothetical protein
MPDSQLTLTNEERTMLVELLETAMKNVLVEEHRTEAMSYRKLVLEKENAISRILEKLKGQAR